VEVVESFTYLGSLIHVSGSSEPEIKRRINIVREAMFTLDQNIWRSSITLETKLRLYNTCILPIFLYGAETWSVTVMLSKKIDALDNWCFRRILNVHWSEFDTNDEIRSRTGQPLLSDTVRSRRLSFFGGNQVEVVESFMYIGSLIHVSGSSEPEIKRRINIVREAMFTLDQNIF